MDSLCLVDGVYTAAFPTRGGANFENREQRLRLLTDEKNIYDEWELVRLEEHKAMLCICGMPAKPGRSVVLQSKYTKVAICIGSQCVSYFPHVDVDLLKETKDGYSREDGFVTDDNDDEEDESSPRKIRCVDEDAPVHRLRPRRPVQYVLFSSDEDDDEEEEVQPPPADLVFRACKDYFSRKVHTMIEQQVFLGYLKSISTKN